MEEIKRFFLNGMEKGQSKKMVSSKKKNFFLNSLLSSLNNSEKKKLFFFAPEKVFPSNLNFNFFVPKKKKKHEK